MAKAVVRKINIAALRMLTTLLCLFDKNLSMEELVEELNATKTGSYNNFVVSKYINTCKSCGIDIQKIYNKYSIINFPIGMKFSPDESKLLYEIKQNSEHVRSSKVAPVIDRFIEKLHLTFFKSNNGLPSSNNYRIIKLFEKACQSNSRVKVVYKNKTFIECLPKELKVVDKKIVFLANENDENFEINPDEVLDVSLLETKKASAESDVVTYELYGNLAKRYQLRENEQIINLRRKKSIVIQNRYEDKEELLHRLMRYDSSCKILKPLSYVKDMKKMIEKSIANYR